MKRRISSPVRLPSCRPRRYRPWDGFPIRPSSCVRMKTDGLEIRPTTTTEVVMPKTCLALMLLAVGACVPANNELVRHHTEDGYHLFQRGSYADARDCFEAALKLKPGDADLLYNVAQCHERLGQGDRAEALYKECLEVDADHAEARHAWLLL